MYLLDKNLTSKLTNHYLNVYRNYESAVFTLKYVYYKGNSMKLWGLLISDNLFSQNNDM